MTNPIEPTAEDYNKFYGLDFDWFALDSTGIIAVFSTAGYGEIPNAVMRQAQAHSAVFEQLALPSWGTTDVWKDYGRLGLFAFDWQHWGGPYLKMAAPTVGIKPELRLKILGILDLPQLDLHFGHVDRVIIPPYKI